MVSTNPRERWFLLASTVAALTAGAAHSRPTSEIAQPPLAARVKPILTEGGMRFKDLNGNVRLDPYEDWRLPTAARVDDLLARMTVTEKAGLMLIDTLNAGCEGAVPAKAFEMVHEQHMRRFILRNVVTAKPACGPDNGFRPGSSVTPSQAAQFTNAMQVLAEGTRLGVPVMFKSNQRNHVESDARQGVSEAAGSFTAFPKEAGLAAAALGQGYRKTGKLMGDMDVLRDFGRVMGAEWRAIGLRGMYGFTADLGTEPRWYRFHETFSENGDLTADIISTLVATLQGPSLTPTSNVALTIKHFPGGGPQEAGLDPHYSFGKHQIYPADRFAEHLKPFRAAIAAGTSSIMPYYGVPIGLTHDGVRYSRLGMAFSKQIVTDLLRGQYGFKGYVNSDTGIITDRGWGLEDRPVPERVATAVNGGTDILSGFAKVSTITDLVDQKLVSEARVDEAARRLLSELFALGLFENPYVDADKAGDLLGSDAHRAVALDTQRKSIVLLQNKLQGRAGATLPLRAGARVYVLGMGGAELAAAGYKVTDGAGAAGARPTAAGHDYAVVRVTVRNVGTQAYRSDDPATGLNPKHLDPATGKPWGAQDACVTRGQKPCTDDGLIFGGALPWEVEALSFTTMSRTTSWSITPSLAEIQAVMREAGPEHTVISIDFRQPYVLDAESGLRNAGAILATFGVGDRALADVLRGAFKPEGRLPFALPASLEAVRNNAPDAAGYAKRDTLYPFGHGLTYR